MVLFGKYMILLLFPHYFATLDPKIGHSKNRSRVVSLPCRYVEYCVIITLQIRIVYVLRAYLKRIVLQLGTFNLCNYRQICCKGIQIEHLIALRTPISILSNQYLRKLSLKAIDLTIIYTQKSMRRQYTV